MRVLMIAPICDGTDVGEAWSNYQWASRLGDRCDLTVLTYHKRDRPSAASQLGNCRVVEWRDWPLVGRWERFNSGLKPGYLGFYRNARRWIRTATENGERFDLVHQVSPLAMRYPSPAAGCSIPLIMGPIGGSLPTPHGFQKEMRTEPWYRRLRRLDHQRLRFDPWLRGTYRRADLLIGVAPYVKALLGDAQPGRFLTMSETGVVRLPRGEKCECHDEERLKLLFVGRVIRSKGVRDAIRALAILNDPGGVTLDIVGAGDDLCMCKREVIQRGLEGVVRFHGRVSRAEVDRFYSSSDVFLFPSFREPSGNAVLEAMSHGLVPIVSTEGGPGEVVPDQAGYRVHPLDPQQYAQELAEAVRQLIAHPLRRRRMGEAARQRIVEEYLWDRKIDRMVDLYQEVREAAPDRRNIG